MGPTRTSHRDAGLTARLRKIEALSTGVRAKREQPVLKVQEEVQH